MEINALQLKAFVPSGADFARARSFFLALGFRENWRTEGLCEFQAGEAAFLLQNFHHKEMQENFMMYLTVRDLDVFYNLAKASRAFETFPEAKLQLPKMLPWGVREVAFSDPAGVCWHVRGK